MNSGHSRFPVRFSVLLFLCGLLFSGGFFTWLYHQIALTRMEMLKNAEWSKVESSETSLLADLKSLLSDTRYLARETEFYLNRGGSYEEELTSIYQNFSLSKPYYHKLRFIANDGNEQIKISNPEGVIAPSDRLKNRRDQSYFQAALSLAPGQIHLSRIELEQSAENETLSTIPVIRTAFQVVSTDGNLLGLVVLNYNASRMLGQVTNDRNLLINREGVILAGGEEEDRFSIQRGNSFRYGEETPESWETIRDNEKGQIVTSNGLFSFTTIYPMQEAADVIREMDVAQIGVGEAPIVWKLVSHVEDPLSLAGILDLRRFLILNGIILAIVLGVGAYIIGRLIQNLNQAARTVNQRDLRMAKIASQSPGMLFEFHLNEMGHPILDYCSNGSKVLFNIDPEEMVGGLGCIEKLVMHEDRQSVFNELQGAKATMSQCKTEFRHRKPDGTIRWILAKAVPENDPEDNTLRWYGYLTDITERKLREEQSSSQYAMLENIIDTMPDIVFYKDTNGRYLGCNKVMCRANGLNRADILGKTDAEIFPPTLADRYMEDDRQLLEHWGASRTEQWVTLRDGTHCLFEFLKAPYFDEDGAIAGILGVGRDVTEQREQKSALEEAQRIANMGNWVLHTDTGRMEWSENVFHIFGLEPHETAPSREEHFKMFLPGETEKVEALIQRALDQGVPYEIKFKIKRTDGEIRTLFSRGFPFSHKDGEIIKLIGTLQDVTEEEMASEALASLNERFTMATESARIGVWDYDFKTDELHWDNIMFELYDVPRSEFEGKISDWTTRLHPEDREAALELIEQAAHGEKAFNTTFRIVCQNSDVRYIRAIGSLYRDETGEASRFVGTNWDVTTERRAQEEAINARKAAEEADKAKSAFLATMSHEIRTPMNGVIGMTQILLQTNLTTEQRDYMNIIRVSGETLLALINDVLDYSKIEAGKLDLEAIPFDLRNCVQEAMEILAGTAHSKGLELAYWVRDGVPQRIVGDVTRLRQILMNLIGNAIKFTPEGEIFVEVVAERCDHENCELHFSVRDTGIGIPLEKQGALFKVFSQVDSSNTRQYGGTGLGLAISKSLCEIMGGKMWVESARGAGSTFHFTIKVPCREGRVNVIPRLDEDYFAGLRALIVDDNVTSRMILSHYTTKWGLVADLATSADEALELCRRKDAHYDVAIVDMHMPEKDGLYFARQYDEEHGKKTMPRVLLSSVGELHHNEFFDGSLNKPFRPEQMLDALKKVITIKREAKPEPASNTSHPHTPVEDKNRIRILLAEDNKINQKVTSLLLGSLGYKADIVENGQEVLDALNQATYDLILLDVQMPVMDGYEAAAAIRQNPKTANNKPYIVALTAGAMQGDRERALATGMNDYLSKPVKKEDLLRAIQQAESTL